MPRSDTRSESSIGMSVHKWRTVCLWRVGRGAFIAIASYSARDALCVSFGEEDGADDERDNRARGEDSEAGPRGERVGSAGDDAEDLATGLGGEIFGDVVV